MLFHKIQLKSVGDISLRLFLTCWFVYTLHFATNTVREIYPALSLAENLSFDVSEYLGFHPDIFEIPGRGAYINNNPGASLLGAIPYAVTRPAIDQIVGRVNTARITSNGEVPEYDTIYPMAREFYRQAYEKGLDIKFGLAAGVMQAFLMAPLSALSVVVMFFILANLTKSTQKALMLALLFGFATPVFYRTAQLNHNLLEGIFAFFAFVLLWRPWDTPEKPGKPYYLTAGLIAGWTIVLDYSGIIVVLIIGLYAFFRWYSQPREERRLADLARFGIGIMISALVLLGYQWLAFGNPFYPAQHYMPQTTFSGYGYQGLDWPQLDLIWLLSFGSQYGIFISAPLLLLVLYIPGWLNNKIRLIGKLETWTILFFSIALLLFTAANQFSRMQFNSGIRHIVPVIPFLFLIAAGVYLRLPTWLAIVFGVFATYWSWALAMYRDVEQGLGIYEAIIQITSRGPQLPWLSTLQSLGLVPSWMSAWIVFTFAGVVLLAIWSVRFPRFTFEWSMSFQKNNNKLTHHDN